MLPEWPLCSVAAAMLADRMCKAWLLAAKGSLPALCKPSPAAPAGAAPCACPGMSLGCIPSMSSTCGRYPTCLVPADWDSAGALGL